MIYQAKVHDACDVESLEDLKQYYGTSRWFGMKSPDGAIRPARIRRFGAPLIEINTIVGGQITIEGELTNQYIRNNGVWGVPLIGNHPLGLSYVFLSRHARRESYKGLDVNNLKPWFPDNQGYAKTNLNKLIGKPTNVTLPVAGGLEECPKGYDIINHIFNPTYQSYSEVLLRMTRGEIFGAPINLCLGLHFCKGNPDIVLNYMDRKIGKVDGNGNIVLYNPTEYLIHYIKKTIPDVLGVN
jgi:hypothetical protein